MFRLSLIFLFTSCAASSGDRSVSDSDSPTLTNDDTPGALLATIDCTDETEACYDSLFCVVDELSHLTFGIQDHLGIEVLSIGSRTLSNRDGTPKTEEVMQRFIPPTNIDGKIIIEFCRPDYPAIFHYYSI